MDRCFQLCVPQVFFKCTTKTSTSVNIAPSQVERDFAVYNPSIPFLILRAVLRDVGAHVQRVTVDISLSEEFQGKSSGSPESESSTATSVYFHEPQIACSSSR